MMLVIYLPVKFEFNWKMLTDRQMDVGHINLIGELVTRNLPKNTTIHVKTIS